MKNEYPPDLTGMQFGTLRVLDRAKGYENENKMWLCRCDCGHKDCKHFVIMRRGNLTRKTNWKLTCGARGNNAEQSAKTKLMNGCVQKNSKTGIPGVSDSINYPGLYRARISVKNHRITMDGLSLNDAALVREAWERIAKII